MERFVFIAAVTIAVLFGIGAMFGNGHHDGVGFHFDFDDEGGFSPAPIVATDAGALAATAYAGDELRIRHIVARVTVTPEDRSDFLIEINSPGGLPLPEVSVDGSQITIDGRLRGRVGDCFDGGARVRGYEDATPERLPVINVRAPRELVLERSGAGTTEVGPTESLDFDFSNCGSATIGDVAGKLGVDLAGSGSITVGAVRTLEADVAGSGDLRVGTIAEGANVDIAGSGTVTLASLTGSLSADSAGSGMLSIEGGAVSVAEIDMAGSGDVNIAAPVETLKASIVGSGDVEVANTVGDLDAEIAGSGSVIARAVTGNSSSEVWGSGEVRIGQ
jgi:hypothetical protein